jgi:ABC-type cobalt transport system substrate-binding protein
MIYAEYDSTRNYRQFSKDQIKSLIVGLVTLIGATIIGYLAGKGVI